MINSIRIKDLFSLVRWPNLIIILITMLLMLFCLINPALGLAPFESGLSWFELLLLMASVLLITMGGYIINDLVDINTDSVNKPGKNLVGNTISENTAQVLYWITTLSGIAAGVLFSYMLHKISYSLIFLFSAGLLWFYSQKYKCQPLVGNVVVGVLSSLSFGLVWLFTFFALSNQGIEFAQVQSSFSLTNKLVLIYVGFAFLITLLRELIKDQEDYTGDNRFGCRTLPVVYGKGVAKVFALFTAYLSLAGLVWADFYYFQMHYYGVAGWFILIIVLLVLMIVRLHRATEKPDFASLSRLSKRLMLLGIVSLIFFYFELL